MRAVALLCTGLAAVAGVVVSLMLAPGASANPVPPNWNAYDATHYALAIDVGDSSISGTGTLVAQAAQSGLDEIVLGLAGELVVSRITSSTDSVTAWGRDGDRLRIFLSEPLAAGDDFDVTVAYSGEPPDIMGEESYPPFNRFTHTHGEESVPVIFTMSVPDRAWAWWPCKPVLGDKATVDMAVTVAENLTAVSNGRLQGVQAAPDQRRTWHWSHAHPVASYLVSLAISDYAVLEDSVTVSSGDSTVVVPLRYYVYPEDAAAARASFARTGEMIKFLSDRFGLYPFADEQYAIAAAPINGGMEHQTCTTLGARYITGDLSEEWVVIHELSHQWWGDWLGLADWRHVWLNEGFATYCEALWVEHTEGKQAYHEYMRELDTFAPPAGDDFPGALYDPSPLFGSTPYRKGAWVLHMLRNVVDDDAVFFDGLKAYYGTLGGQGRATTESFRDVMEAATGLELDAFFDQWIYESGRPDYRWTWTYAPAASGYEVILDLEQQQATPAVYSMPVDVEIDAGGNSQVFRAQNNARTQRFTFAVVGEPRALTIDPDGWLLKPVPAAPPAHALLQSPRPNPTRGTSRITYTLAEAGEVSLHVLDVTGRLVRTLIDRRREGGEHTVEWDGRLADGRAPAGVYYLYLDAPGATHHRTLVLVR